MIKDKVAVVIPVKNRPTTIRTALDSVMRQRDVSLEVIVVDDGSTDDTADIISREYSQVLLLRNSESIGGSGARNIGASAAESKYVAFLDSDDEWLPDHLSSSLRVMRESNVQGVFSPFFLCSDSGEKEIVFAPRPDDISIGEAILSNYRFDVRTSTLVFQTESFLKVRFDEELKKHQDWDLAIQFELKYQLALKKTPTVRINTSSTDNRMSSGLNHSASFYFINKNRPHLRSSFLFNFCLKQLYRINRSGSDKRTAEKYMDFMKKIIGECGVGEKIVFSLLRHGLLDLNWLRNLKTWIYQTK